MLTEIKDRATGWIAWIIVILISIPFALWGVNEYFSGGSSVTVATVDGVEIDEDTYRRELDTERRRVQQLLGGQLAPGYLNSPEFRRGVLDGLVDRTLLSRYTEREGYRVGDDELARRIRQFPQFQRDGQFDVDRYRAYLAQTGYSASGFEAQMRRWAGIEQVGDGLSESAFVTEGQRNALLATASETRAFQQLVASPSHFVDEIDPDEDALRAEYEADPARFTVPEQVRVEYLRLSLGTLERAVEVEEADLMRYYETNRARWRTEGTRRASHILLPFASDADDEQMDAVRTEAEELLERIRSGESFADLAREHSGDPGSANAGGDLGLVFEGVYDPAFERALMALELDEVSEPVRTRFGYHLIKLTEFEPDQIEPFEAVRAEIEESERRRIAQERFLDLAEEFRNLVFEQPESLEPAADFLQLPLRTSGWFSRDGGSDISQHPAVVEAAFSDDVYLAGLNSDVIEIGTNDLVALRKEDERPETVPAFEDVRDEVAELLRRRLAAERAQDLVEAALETLRDDPGAWPRLVAEFPEAPERRRAVRAIIDHNAREVALFSRVFAMPEPESFAAPTFDLVRQPDGSHVLIRLDAVVEGDPDELEAEIRDGIEQALAQRWGVDLFEGHLRGLRESREISLRRQDAEEMLF